MFTVCNHCPEAILCEYSINIFTNAVVHSRQPVLFVRSCTPPNMLKFTQASVVKGISPFSHAFSKAKFQMLDSSFCICISDLSMTKPCHMCSYRASKAINLVSDDEDTDGTEICP